MQVLTVLPKSCSIRKVEREFKVSNYIARKPKRLVEDKGLLSMPNPRSGKILSDITVDNVKYFYNSDQVSRIMPGMKHYVSVTANGKGQHVRLHLLSCTLI